MRRRGRPRPRAWVRPGWCNHELNVENDTGIRKVVTASQKLAASSARVEETMRQLSGSLAGQLKELATRLDDVCAP